MVGRAVVGVVVAEGADKGHPLHYLCDARQVLTIRAAGGHRPPRKIGTAYPLKSLRRCARALHNRRAEVLRFSRQDAASEPERLALFSPTTKTGVLLPFFAGPRTQGLLILGEERESRCQPLSAERVAILELVASRIGHIVRISRRLEYERMGDRRRQRQLTVERQRLARDLHDNVGQALSALLVQIRCAISEGEAGREELQVLDSAAARALDGARALAYGIGRLERGAGALEEARSYAETMLRSVHCRLSWVEERTDLPIAGRTLREIGHVIKESITNIVRHARATSVRIRVEYPDGRIRVSIHDDGVGFVQAQARPMVDARDSAFPSPDGPFDRVETRLVVRPEDCPDDFASSVQAAIKRAQAMPVDSGSRRLSGREQEILIQVARGKSTKEIARAYAITPKTVGNHVGNIRQKLHLHHRGQLVLFAVEQGLASP